MAVIHRTTLVPSKLDLLGAWLPQQAWFAGQPGRPPLAKAGGFRLDDPDGQVGIEFMVVRDDAAREEAAYLVPMTYRGSPLAGRTRRSSGRRSMASSDRAGSMTEPRTRCSWLSLRS